MPSIATNITPWPSARSASASASSAAGVDRRRRASSAVLPSATSRPSTVPDTPLPVCDCEVAARRQCDAALLRALDDRRGQRMLAAPFERRGQAQHLVFVEAVRRPRPRSAWACPSVSVPVLSTTSVSTFSISSSASAFLTSTPACAPRPVPTMIDIGVARPSAHGQAMISTAMALTSAWPKRGSGPNSAPDDERRDRDTSTTPGTNQPETLSASFWIGARERCASATMRTICDEHACRVPTRSARISKRAGAVDRRAGDLVARHLLDRDRLAA